MKIHRSITISRVFEAVKRYQSSLDNPGFCIACGKEIDGVEPGARRYECYSCNEKTVYGAEELFSMIA